MFILYSINENYIKMSKYNFLFLLINYYVQYYMLASAICFCVSLFPR